jgi:hypothetical protein
MLMGISGSLEMVRIRAGQGRVAELERYIEAAMTSVNRAGACQDFRVWPELLNIFRSLPL